VFDDNDMTAIAGLRELESLSICPSRATDAAMTVLGNFAGLRRFSFYGFDDLTEKGAANIWGLRRLRELHAGLVGVGKAVPPEDAIAGITRLNELEEVSLSGKVNDAALMRLAALKKLRSLDLTYSTGYTDDGLAALMKSSRSLVVLKFAP
jgi:hypothetical protein